MEDKKGFFDGNPKMLFVFGLVTGVAAVSLFGGGINLPSLNAGDDDEAVAVFDEVPAEVELVLAPVTSDDHIIGDINTAKVVLIEYSDFECPFCSRHHPTMADIAEEYSDDVAWVYRHFPLSFHPEGQASAEASECAGEQGEFWEYADEMYSNQEDLGEDLYYDVARDLRLDMDQFEDCLTSGRYVQDVMDDLQSGVNAGVQGTPATFVNGMLVSGAVPYETMVDAIEQILGE